MISAVPKSSSGSGGDEPANRWSEDEKLKIILENGGVAIRHFAVVAAPMAVAHEVTNSGWDRA